MQSSHRTTLCHGWKVAQLWPESSHSKLKMLGVRKMLLLTFEYTQLIPSFFFIVLNYLFPISVQRHKGLIHLDKQGGSLGPHFQRATGLVQTSHTTCGSNAQIAASAQRARWLSFLHPYPLQWLSWIMSRFHLRQHPRIDPALSLHIQARARASRDRLN